MRACLDFAEVKPRVHDAMFNLRSGLTVASEAPRRAQGCLRRTRGGISGWRRTRWPKWHGRRCTGWQRRSGRGARLIDDDAAHELTPSGQEGLKLREQVADALGRPQEHDLRGRRIGCVAVEPVDGADDGRSQAVFGITGFTS